VMRSRARFVPYFNVGCYMQSRSLELILYAIRRALDITRGSMLLCRAKTCRRMKANLAISPRLYKYSKQLLLCFITFTTETKYTRTEYEKFTNEHCPSGSLLDTSMSMITLSNLSLSCCPCPTHHCQNRKQLHHGQDRIHFFHLLARIFALSI
jgi:hypothetical protein